MHYSGFLLWVERSLGGGLNEKTIVLFISLFSHAIGSYAAGFLLQNYKRKIILFLGYLFTFISSVVMYSCFHSFGIGVVVAASVLGFFFGIIPSAFAIYFPEIFPTKIRATAEGFCYSTGRFVTAFGVLYSGYLVQKFSGNIGFAASLMSVTFLIGAVVSLFAKETDKTVPI